MQLYLRCSEFGRVNSIDLDYLNQNLRVYDDKDNELSIISIISIISIESNKYDTLAFVIIIKLKEKK